MTQSKKILIDTNYLVRFLVKDNDDQLEKIIRLFEQGLSNEVTIFVDTSSVFETYYVLSEKIYQLPKSEIIESLSNLINFSFLNFFEKNILIEALELPSTNNIDLCDCYLVSKCIDNNLDFVSFDKKACKLFEITK
jgi:predicted nucleic-acid-binding protein